MGLVLLPGALVPLAVDVQEGPVPVLHVVLPLPVVLRAAREGGRREGGERESAVPGGRRARTRSNQMQNTQLPRKERGV